MLDLSILGVGSGGVEKWGCQCTPGSRFSRNSLDDFTEFESSFLLRKVALAKFRSLDE